MGFASGFFSIF
ncbi:hypothetical protein VCCP1047_3057, partial [Vibrio cholerae CP1047(20)]